MSQTYSDVDSSDDPKGAVAWQSEMAEWPAVAAYKGRTRAILSDAARVLDIGCGPGVDLANATAQVGVDRSIAMCSTAAADGATVVCGDAHALPFDAGSFDGVRADRVFQHLAEPVAALDEALRVLASGGRIVVADPDQETLVIQVPGVRQSMLDRLKQLRRDVGYRNGRLAYLLPALFEQQGLVGIGVEPFALVLGDPAQAFGLPGWPELWRSEGGFTDDELDEWRAAIAAASHGFVYAVTFLVVTATKP